MDEGAPLLRAYRVYSLIEGSNPSLSASKLKEPLHAALFACSSEKLSEGFEPSPTYRSSSTHTSPAYTPRMFLRPALLLCLLIAACNQGTPSPAVPTAPGQSLGRCAPDTAALELTGSAANADAKTYRILPFTVAPGTGRVEVSYRWTDKAGPPSTPLTATTLDLGLYDEKGYRNPAGFRGWGGSRQGRIDQNKPPVFVQADSADRGFNPGLVNAGIWSVELGIAAVSPQGADWLVKIECKSASGSLPASDPVDRNHTARIGPGWYHGDFHMHAFHSNPNAPDWDDFIAQARTAKLDFLMVTEYVTGRHWETLGAVQRMHPDLLIWPGREIITYFGHANTLGETPGVFEYRHGFEDVSMGEIQREAKAQGALFQVNHPTIFPPPLFSNLCRGCYFELGDQIDWNQVDTLEVVNGPVLATSDDIGFPVPIPGQIENPFLQTALNLWDDLLKQGYKLTAVSGSDSKGVDAVDQRARKGYGSSATAVYAANLSRESLSASIKDGRAYIRTRGVAGSPLLEFEARTEHDDFATFGGTVPASTTSRVTLTTTVTGGAGQLLTYLQNGVPVLSVPIVTDPFVHSFAAATRNPLTEGPLGTHWRIETRDAMSRTAIGNPVFLKGG